MSVLDGTGDLPSGWAWARLGDLGAWTGGGTPSKANPGFWAGGEVPWVSPKDMKAERVGEAAERITVAAVRSSAAKMVPAGSVLCVVRSGILKHTFPVAIAECALTLNQDMRALTPAAGVDADYVRLFLALSNDAILHRCAKDGTTVASINPDQLAAISVPLAPAAEQARIVKEVKRLSAELDEAEAALAQARASLAEYRASLLHAACTGQLTAAWRAARPPPAENGPALLRRVLAERRAAWERAELARLHARGKPTPVGERWKARYSEPAAPDMNNLPELPPEWTWASLDQLSWASNYGTSTKCDTDETGIPVLRIPNVQSGSLEWSNLKYTKDTFDLRNSDLLATGDLLVVRTNGSPGLLGRAAVIDHPTNRPSYFASYLIRFRLLGSPMLHKWIAALFGSGLVRRQVDRSAATSAGQYNISQTNLARFALPLPPMDEIAQLLSELADNVLIDEGWPNSETAASLRQSILHAALTGRLVPQDAADEPAAALLARLRADPAVPRRTRKQARAA